jgi:hypothetical protein
VGEDGVDGFCGGDAGEDAHVGAAVGTGEGEDLIDAGKEASPAGAGGGALQGVRQVGGIGVWRCRHREARCLPGWACRRSSRRCRGGGGSPARAGARARDVEEIRDHLHVDSLGYLSLPGWRAPSPGMAPSATPASPATTRRRSSTLTWAGASARTAEVPPAQPLMPARVTRIARQTPASSRSTSTVADSP